MLATGHYGTLLERQTAVELLTNPCRVVVVIMALSSLAFYAMAFRVPVVSQALLNLQTLLTSCSKNASSTS